MKLYLFLLASLFSIASFCFMANDAEISVTTVNQNTFSVNIETNVLNISKNGSIYWTDTIDGAFSVFAMNEVQLNQDEHLDVSIELADADAEIQLWYVYNPSTELFEKVTGLEWIVNPKKVDREGQYFYSRAPNGCSGSIWTSHLVRCDGSILTVLGTIEFDGCTEGAEADDGLNVNFTSFKNGSQVQIVEKKKTIIFLNNEPVQGLDEYWLKKFKKYA